MKKFLKITGIVVGVLLLLMIVFPFAFQGKIKEVVVKEGNKMIDARFDFRKLSLSLFRNFPSVSASLYDFYIVGKDRFEGDTLVRAGRVTVAFNLASLWKDTGYEVSKVAVENTMLRAIMLEDSTANWDIMKPQPETAEESDTTASAVKIKLNNLTINNLSLSYDDRAGKMYASVGDMNASMSGDLGAARSTLKLVADASGIVFKTGGVPYLNGADFYTKLNVDAEIEKGKYTLAKSVLRLNAIEADLDGWVEMLDNEGYDMDLKFSTPKVSFKEILSLIPAIYAKDFADVQATGEVALDGWAKGTYLGDRLPAFNLGLKVTDGTFRYPSLPAGVDGINITAKVENPGGVADLTTVLVDPFRFSLAGNPFYVKAWIATPVSNMAFDLEARGKLDLGKVKDVYPLDSMELNGVVDADVKVAGTMASIEKEQYEQLHASGVIALYDMLLKQSGTPDVNIKKSTLTFTPRYLALSETALLIGRNDLTLDARVENYIAYALKDKTLKGTMNLKSSYLNVSDFMGGSEEETTADTTSMSSIEVPKNLDLAVNASLAKILYDGLEIDNLAGNITVQNGTANLKNLSMNTLDGSVKMNGHYSIAKSVDAPEFAADLAMSGLSFSKTFLSFVAIRKMVPIFEGLTGSFSGAMNLSTTLDRQMSPVMESMNGHGSLTTKDLSLSQVAALQKIAELASIGGMMSNKVKDLKIDFTIEQGKVRTKPFDIRLGETLVNLSGTTSLDQSIDYVGKVTLPPSVAAVTRMQTANVKIGGTFSSPQVSLDVKDMASQVVASAVKDLVGEAGKKLGIDLSDAQAQKDALVKAATDGGEQIMAEARKQADALVAKAGNNALAKIAAQQAAATAITAAQRRVDDMVAKATAKGDSIISKAQIGQ
ncbi:MAG: AsmA family protein [Rikenellaceae bacterium]|jgi:hypothetical protein|nr:AsmA family protein [Rikenellaceae bacterium]